MKLPALGEDALFIAKITHKGSSNFAVWTVGGDGERLDLLVNEIGSYSGTVPLNFQEDPAAIQIEASGTWKITVQSLAKAPRWTGSASGKGDSVLLVAPGTLSGLSTAKITHSGRSNFAVRAWGDSLFDLLVNEIGKYSGEVLVDSDTVVLEITADGSWTIQKVE